MAGEATGMTGADGNVTRLRAISPQRGIIWLLTTTWQKGDASYRV